MRKFLFIALFVFISTPVFAQSTVTFEAGKAYSLTASQDCTNATAYKVVVDKAQVGSDLPPSACVSGTVTTPTLPALPAGVHTFAIDTYNGALVAPGGVLTATALAMPNPAGVPTIKVTTTTVQHLKIQADGTTEISNVSSTSVAEKIQ